jgi:uncharacterized protein (TIGR02452 family)
MAKRATRAQTARETLTILETGAYLTPGGTRVDVSADLAAACAQSVLYAPADFHEVYRRRDQLLREQGSRPPCAFEVVNETTLHAARRLVGDGSVRVLALNFASARHLGGGFLQGSEAQEESLARASGLYACLRRFPQMYEHNQQLPTCLYSDHMIYAPAVPVFRDDDDTLLEGPYRVSFLTAPAVNAGAVRRNEPARVAEIEAVMRDRTEKVLALALLHGYEGLVLGAWGCGVFGNDPASVARFFAQHLTGAGLFRDAFRRVVFAVLDRSADGSTIRPFGQLFAGSL